MNIYKSSKDNKLRQFTFRVVHRIITTKKELLKYKLASDDKCPFCLNPDSIEHTFLFCQKSKEFFSKTLRWFNEYHKENVQLSNKQILFNTFDDSLPMQMPISTQRKLRLLVLLQKKYFYTCKNIVTKPNLEEFLCKHFEHYIALKIVANNIEHVWQLTGRGKKVKFPRIFRGKFVEKSADYTGNFRGETSPRINQ